MNQDSVNTTDKINARAESLNESIEVLDEGAWNCTKEEEPTNVPPPLFGIEYQPGTTQELDC